MVYGGERAAVVGGQQRGRPAFADRGSEGEAAVVARGRLQWQKAEGEPDGTGGQKVAVAPGAGGRELWRRVGDGGGGWTVGERLATASRQQRGRPMVAEGGGGTWTWQRWQRGEEGEEEANGGRGGWPAVTCGRPPPGGGGSGEGGRRGGGRGEDRWW